MSNKKLDTPVRRTDWPASASRPLGTPLQTSVVYKTQTPDAMDALYEGGAEGFTYAREGHPNAAVLARKLDLLEGGEGGIVTGSGMSAISAALLGVLQSGDHIVGGDQLYGRCLRLMSDDCPRFGIETSLADPTDVNAMKAAVRDNTKMVLIETVSNPTLRVADIEGIAKLCKERGILLAIDNTFTTPRAIKPLEYGADIVVHSVTKLLAGHSDVTLGYVLARDPALRKSIYDFATTTGLTASPFDCWMAERGLYTFDLRFERASQTALVLADMLGEHPAVNKVLYPGRPDHPDHTLAHSLFGEIAGNMVSFELVGGREAANAFTAACPNIGFAPTLGDVATTLSHPPSSSHRALSAEDRLAIGITEGFFRMSVGVEPVELLIQELLNALDHVHKT